MRAGGAAAFFVFCPRPVSFLIFTEPGLTEALCRLLKGAAMICVESASVRDSMVFSSQYCSNDYNEGNVVDLDPLC